MGRSKESLPAESAPASDLGRRPVLTFWLIAVGLEVLLGVAFLVSGAEDAISDGLSKAGIDFGSDLLTAARVLVAYPAALLGVTLALAQVAAPDLAVVLLARIRGGRALLHQVAGRLRPWSREVGVRRGLAIWLTVILVFTACTVASGLLHRIFVPDDLVWQFSWSMLALLPVAMFLDAGALLEENGWRGFALPVLLRTRGPVAASVVMTFFWARAGQATLLAIAMHGLSNDVARIGGLVDGDTWQSSTISELNLAAPFIVLALALIPYATRTGWGDLRGLRPIAGR